MAVSQEKITVYNLADLKNTSDDAIPNYLNSLKFTQSHHLTDVRLALGYGAFALAAACFLWDYKFGFESTKTLTALAVALYSAINGALTLWIYYVERGCIYQGTTPSGDATLRISSQSRKNEPTYHLTVEVTRKGSSKAETLTVSRPFSEWFDAAGHFVAAPFQTMIATGIPVVGALDSKRLLKAREAAGTTAGTPGYTPEILEALASAAGTASGAEAASGTDAKKGGKRRKA